MECGEEVGTGGQCSVECGEEVGTGGQCSVECGEEVGTGGQCSVGVWRRSGDWQWHTVQRGVWRARTDG